ncbi:MAG: ATP-binding protein [Planctomycetota bacterium]
MTDNIVVAKEPHPWWKGFWPSLGPMRRTLSSTALSLPLAPLVEDVVGSCATLAAEAGVGMRVRTQPALVEGDDARLRELITNLCVNAIRHNLDGGTVEVTLESVGAQAVLRVSDTGPGIAPEDHERIFERFYRVDKARSRAEGGSGLGLAIARWIAEMHQGQISVESTLGKGASFIVEIPFVRSPEVEGRRENPDLEYRR